MGIFHFAAGDGLAPRGGGRESPAQPGAAALAPLSRSLFLAAGKTQRQGILGTSS